MQELKKNHIIFRYVITRSSTLFQSRLFYMIFTSNKNPALWREDFDENTTRLCALDRIFDEATMFKLRGESFRGKKLETVSLQTGKLQAVESLPRQEE